jgi:hypothetical protein
MVVLLITFAADMLFGILADIIVNNKQLNAKKFLAAFAYLAMYLFIITMVYVVGERMGDETEALFVDKMITYVFAYFYLANILKNARLLFPGNRQIKFLDFLIGLEFTKKIPSLGEFLEKEKQETDNKFNQ